MKKLLCLHGMFGSYYDWDFLSQKLTSIEVHCLNLPGHDDVPLAESFDESISILALKINALKPDFILGYSLGGRLLHYMRTHNLFDFKPLYLYESSYLLNLSKEEKKLRKQSDELLSQKLLQDPKLFFESWYKLPLWQFDQKLYQSHVQEKIDHKQDQFSQWAKALTLFSPALIEYKENSEQELSYYFYGQNDHKYRDLALSLDPRLFKSIEIPYAGHNTHLSNPDFFLQELIKLTECVGSE